jgi:hypothetical protein
VTPPASPNDKPERDAKKIVDASVPPALDAAIENMIVHAARNATTGFTETGYDATLALAQALGATMKETALHGASAVLKAYDAARKSAGWPVAESISGGLEIPFVPPTEAIRALLAREPRLAASAAEVSRLYSTEHVFAAARAVETTVLEKVQGAIVEALRTGVTEDVAGKVIADLADWRAGYSNTVFRNAAMQSYADGETATAKMPGVRDVIVGAEYAGPTDSDARPNHKALVGFRASIDDPRWKQIGPISGHNCRHSKVLIDIFHADRQGWLTPTGELRRMEIPAGGGADPGFRPA